MLQLGLSGGDGTPEGVDKVAIISNNRPEWLMTDLACQQIGVSLCPIYPTTNAAEIAFIFNDAQVKYVFVSDDDLFEKVNQLAPTVSSLRGIFSFDRIAGVRHWSEILELATPALEEQVLAIKQRIAPSHIATIIYTSGTTGTPKGVML
jgi:long-chain acyl-CoA synthetase